ncbi:hypothetical protein M3Y98_01144300 [Aphelenchoides besseyi]|nr:hypothetical protein M3Y98_01144300 [Aphelenchoides besseyi]
MRVTRSKRKAAEVEESEENSPSKRLSSSTSPKLPIQNENSSDGLGSSITLRSSRQRKATKKLEESYNMGLSSLIGTALSVTNVSKSPKPKQKEVVNNKRKSPPEAKKSDETLKHIKPTDNERLKNGKVHQDFQVLQGAVLKHTPGLFTNFMSILRETHEYMMHQTSFMEESDDDISTSDIKKELENLKLNLIQNEKT